MSQVEGVAGLTELSCLRGRPWWRRALSLRSLMGAVLIIGCGLGWGANRIATRARAIAAIRAAGGGVIFRDALRGPKTGLWIKLYGWTGVEFCREVNQVNYVADKLAPPLLQPRPDDRAVAGRIAAAVAALPETETFHLAACVVVASDLDRLARTQIKQLFLERLTGFDVDRPTASDLLPHVKDLQVGMVDGAELPHAILDFAARLPGLERLYLETPLAPVHGSDLAPLARLRHLNLLSLNRTAVDEAAVAILDEMPALRAIWIRRARIGDATLARIVARHPNLASIEVDGSALTDAGVGCLVKLPRLTMVILRGTSAAPGRLTDASLIALGRVKTLRRLVVTCGRFDAAGLDGLRGLPFLRLALRSVEPGSTPALIRLIQGQRLDWLALGGPGVTDDLVPHLAASLVPRRAILDLSDSAITDAALTQLAPLPIDELHLNRTAIGDAGLAAVPIRLGPRNLSLRETKASPAGSAAFGRAHPGVLQPDRLLDED